MIVTIASYQQQRIGLSLLRVSILLSFVSIIASIITSSPCNAQGLGSTKWDIIKKNGTQYYTETGGNGIVFMIYDEQIASENETITMSTSYYLKNDTCFALIVYLPKSEMNDWVKILNELYVPVKELKWKDYSGGQDIQIFYEKDDIISIRYRYSD